MSDRRDFLRKLFGIGIVASCGGLSFVFTRCANIPHILADYQGNGFILSKDAFGDGSMVVVHHRRMEGPVMVRKKNDGGFQALLLICTHKGCNPNVSEYFLDCPCHGSRYSVEGKVIKGPAETDLKSLDISEDEERDLIIRL